MQSRPFLRLLLRRNPGSPSRATVATVYGINNATLNYDGQVVGYYDTHGFLRTGGVYFSIDYSGAQVTVAHGINDPGDIVGYYQDAAGTTHGFLKQSGQNPISFDYPGTTIGTWPTSINDAGQIVGY